MAEGADGTVLVDVVTLLHVGQDFLVGSLLPLGLQLVVAALGTDFGRCHHENFQLGVGEDGSADVASVHHDALFLAHLLLQLH